MALRPTGDAALTRNIGRTWSVRLGANRGVQFLEGFAEPMMTNSVTASFGGALGRRRRFVVVGDLFNRRGRLDQCRQQRLLRFPAQSDCTSASAASAGSDTQYFYSSHQFGHDIQLAPGLANDCSDRACASDSPGACRCSVIERLTGVIPARSTHLKTCSASCKRRWWLMCCRFWSCRSALPFMRGSCRTSIDRRR